MHELSIAYRIVEIAEEQAREHKAKKIEEIELEVGLLAGVEIQALDFALESAVKGTMLEKAKIIRHEIEGRGHCYDCGLSFATDVLSTPCPSCGSFSVKLMRGKELRVKSILITKRDINHKT